MIATLADSLTRGIEGVAATVSETLFEPVVRLGVTGLSRAGKTVFITSLVANLLDRGRMPQLSAAASGAIEAVWLQPQPTLTLPRFDYEGHLAALTGAEPRWPESTRSISELRLSFRIRPGGIFGGLRGAVTGPRIVHLDIVDYPGEWLLDLRLIGKSFADWSAEVLGRADGLAEATAFREHLAHTDPGARHDEAVASALAESYRGWLGAARAAGMSDTTPGRFLLPGEFDGSPVLTFAPLPPASGRVPRGSLRAEFERRFEGYKSRVVAPLFREHFARIDRQVVLADVLGALHAGPAALEDLRRALAGILTAFRPGQAAWLTRLLGARRVERILFAATKADHIHHTQHARLAAIAEALLREARDRARFAGARTMALAIASLRATTEKTRVHDGRQLDCVQGRLQGTGRLAAFWPGELPQDPSVVLTPAREGATIWPAGEYGAMAFAPAPLSLRPDEGPPHIRLDRAAEFLIGDRLR